MPILTPMTTPPPRPRGRPLALAAALTLALAAPAAATPPASIARPVPPRPAAPPAPVQAPAIPGWTFLAASPDGDGLIYVDPGMEHLSRGLRAIWVMYERPGQPSQAVRLAFDCAAGTYGGAGMRSWERPRAGGLVTAEGELPDPEITLEPIEPGSVIARLAAMACTS